ncbi:MAG: hypothetical protein K2K90_09820 [Lachnospiraceae bacterium]|nr:hypothetical protein [Lachnospiraceae bacterium]
MQLDISLDKSARRPIARLEWFSGCRALIDTGALFPVWTKSESLLIKLGGKLEPTMFENMIYTIDTINKYISIDTKDNQIVRILKVSDEYGKLSVYLAGTYETEVDYQKCK